GNDEDDDENCSERHAVDLRCCSRWPVHLHVRPRLGSMMARPGGIDLPPTLLSTGTKDVCTVAATTSLTMQRRLRGEARRGLTAKGCARQLCMAVAANCPQAWQPHPHGRGQTPLRHRHPHYCDLHQLHGHQ